MKEKIVLIDGHSILNRAFYGVPDLTNSEGLHTNAIYGFLNILFRILEEESPKYLLVAFDRKAPTFRHEIYADYKGTRKPMPQELREQVGVIQEVLQAMGIVLVQKDGLEADDILGTIATQAEEKGFEVTLVSGDKDLLQIASDVIKIRIPKTRGGKTQVEDYYANDVYDKYQVTPKQFIDLKALMGDSSDNIPGVPKIGEKTATELMVNFGSLEGIYEHLEEVKKKSIKESLGENKHMAELSRVLATIQVDSDIEYSLEDAKIGDFYTEDAYRWFKKLEFKNLLNRFHKESQVTHSQAEYFQLVTEFAQVEEIFTKGQEQEMIGIFPLLEHKGNLIGVALAFGEEDIYVVLAEGLITSGYLQEKIRNMVTQGRPQKVLSCFGAKTLYGLVQAQEADGFFDVAIAAYLLNPLKSDYETEDVAKEFLNLYIPTKNQVFGKESFADIIEKKPQEFLEYAGFGAYTCYAAYLVLKSKLEESQMLNLFYEIEMPLSLVLYEMEQEGIAIKPDALHEYGQTLQVSILELEKAIYEMAGVQFNINSPKQLGEVLFETLQIPGGKKTKTGYSTAADILEKLEGEYPIIAKILEYRGLTKLKSTYADGLANYITAENRIHSTFCQTITATGRLSSIEPNLQNIPIRLELGRQIRKVFVPKENYVFVDADYSQIELRILAHMSEDENLIAAYKSGKDIHRSTASQVFHIPFEEVTSLQRSNAKAVNFGIVYGISSFGLSQDLSISNKEAKEYIERYFATYPKIKAYLDSLIEGAKEKGYVTTLFGRRRPVPELQSSNFMQRSFGERVAMNSPIQGTAADIMKIAMIRVRNAIKQQGLKSRLILQVHDELLIETAQDEIAAVQELLEIHMKEAANLSVELEIDSHIGEDWYEVK